MTTSPTPTHTPSSPSVANTCRWLGAALVLTGVCLPALNNSTDLPHWDVDLLVAAVPMTGLGPAGFIAIGVLIALGGALVFLAATLSGEPVRPAPVAVVGAVAGAVAWHSWGSPVGTIADQYQGALWVGGFIGALALAQACRDERIRAAVGACLLGLVLGLCFKGVVQLGVEHPAMVEHFRENKAAMLASQGLMPDTPVARSYERRVLQAEPTAWFALANVFGTFAAAAMAGFGAIGVLLMRRTPPKGRLAALPIVVISVTCGTMAILSGSKGTLATLALAIVLINVIFPWRRLPSRRVLTALALACIAAPIAAVVARTLVGERLGELSLLFRGMYWQTAARMVAQHPLAGVGPGGFQAAFTILKPPLCPEDVRSAHNAFVDWWSMLGIAGLAASLLVVLAAVRSAAAIADDRDAPSPTLGPLRPTLRLALGAAAACTIISAYLEVAGSTPLTAGTRVGVLIVWALGAWAVAHAALTAPLRPALALAALTLLVQSQIEVTATWPPSAALALALIGAATPQIPLRNVWGAEGEMLDVRPAHQARGRRSAPDQLRRFAAPAALALCTLTAAALLTLSFLPAARWERALADAADLVAPLPELRGTAVDRVAPLLSAELARPIAPTRQSVDAALAEVSRLRLGAAAAALDHAWSDQPSDWRTGRELSRVLAALSKIPGQRDDAAGVAAVSAAERAASLPTARAGAATWAATIWLAIPAADPAKADAWLVTAYKRDPYNPSLAYQLARLADDRADPAARRDRAREALRLQDFARLDPVGRGLSESQVVQLRAWAAEP